ncbi:Hsp70 family protein [Actinokineospora sp. G85]|uniref:Hsp70 family protein n=1 Tax=Actinokineospora sp. G85 TaxID=3406626 RepID=UPI003C72C547
MGVLVVDFGTSNTVAAYRLDGSPRLVAVDGAPWAPSAVFAAADGSLVVGGDALRMGRAAPDRVERTPKSRLGEGELLLGDRVVPVTDAVRAVLAHVVGAAHRQAGAAFAELVLTHPADWGPVRTGALRAAAEGLAPAVSLVPEPVAAAAHAAADPVLVLDLGGGTCDAAVVARGPRGLLVLACAGLPDLGGEDLDQRLVDHVVTAHPDLVEAVDAVDSAALRAAARTAKELLSRHPAADVPVPGHDPVRVTRAEFDGLIAADVERVAALARRVVADSGTRPAVALLVGGSSRVPALAQRPAAAVGLETTPAGEPETAVALGALALTEARPAPARATVPVAAPRVERAGRGRALLPALAAGVVAVVAILVLALVTAPDPVTGTAVSAGTAVDAAPAPEPMPPAIPGEEAANRAEPPFTPAEVGKPATYVHPDGTRLDVTVEDVASAGSAPDPFGSAPAGLRWVTVRVRGTVVEAPDPIPGLAWLVDLIDDRGQRFGGLTVEVVACAGQGKPAEGNLAAGESTTACMVIPVPRRTPVAGVAFGETKAGPPKSQAPLLFPVALPALDDSDPTITTVGRAGGDRVDLLDRRNPLRVRAEAVTGASGYLSGSRVRAGARAIVLRYQVEVIGDVDYTNTPIWMIRDDRGTLIRETPGYYSMPECPYFSSPVRPGAVKFACAVFELDLDAQPTGVVFTESLSLSTEIGRDMAKWPMWTVD